MKLDPIRRRVLELIAHRDPPTDLKAASIACGKNHAYLHQFIHRGTPRKLPEDVRHLLAAHLGIDEGELRDGTAPKAPSSGARQASAMTTRRAVTYARALTADSDPAVAGVPEVQIIASAGGGTLIDQERRGETWYFPTAWLHHELHADAETLRIISIDGDSMEPILESGDKILVDTARKAPSPPGIFVLFDGMGLVAKQLEPVPNTEPARVLIRSANPRYQDYERTVDEVSIVGRVVWFARRV
ncbi:MAG: peptidase S24 [Alphaproteobacteria bacterium]|nr:peptidase S24 [Alphaproteobacteria bacterium]